MLLSDEQVEQVEKLASLLSIEQIADFIGIADSTLRGKIKADARISGAYARGRAKAIATMARSVFRSAIEGNTTDARFYLQSHAGWSTATRQEHTGKGGGPIEHRVTSVVFTTPGQGAAQIEE